LVHGGVLATLADAAIGLALRTKLRPGQNHVTLQLNVHYLSALSEGAILASGTAVKSGGRAGYGEAEIRADDGRLVVRASATFLTVEGDERAQPGS
jgi:uncharacterized protein (TIGR00369 family)